MRGKFKKFVVYLLVTMIVLPVWTMMGMGTASKVSAKSVSGKVYDYTDANYPSGDWHEYDAAGIVDERYSHDYHAKAKVDIEPIVSKDPGLYDIYAEWRVWNNRSKDVTYQVLENGSVVSSDIHIDQSVNADGEYNGNDEMSGYKLIFKDIDLTGDNTKVKLINNSSDGKIISFVSLKISHQNVAPSAPVLVSPYDGYDTGIDTKKHLIWEESTDSDDNNQIIHYQIQIDEETPFIGGIAYECFKLSYYLDIKPLSEGPHTWRVRAFDGESYSDWSETRNFTKTDKTNPIIDSITASAALPGQVSNIIVTAHDNLGLSNAEISIDGGATLAMTGSNSPFTFSYTVPISTTTAVPFDVTVYDTTGNSVIGSGQIETESVLSAPVISAIQGNDKSITVSFYGVGGDVVKYEVFINGVYREVTALAGDAGHLYNVENIEVGDWGTYSVYVKAISLLQSTDSATIMVNVKKPALIGPVPVTYRSSFVSSAQAAESTVEQPTVTEEALIDDGQIKGEEIATEEESNEKINWTPWIILFILILLAGAATGGYFYWFASDEDVQDEVKPKTETAKKPVAGAKPKSSAKKPRRW